MGLNIDYILTFRIGRTGRAGMKGESLTFITRSGEDIWKTMGIVEVMQRSGQFVPPEIQQMVDGHLARQARVATKILGEGRAGTCINYQLH